MKKLFIFLAVIAALTLEVNATKHTVTISGTSYSPAVLSANIGDTITINASTFHPLVQVSKAIWNIDEVAELAGGWGTTSKNHTFKVSTSDTLYYVCANHASLGMKGRVIVARPAGINDLTAEKASVSVYPNPMTSTGTVKLSSFGSNMLSVQVFNIAGQLEKDLTSALTNLNGEYLAQFDAGTLSSGLHFILVSEGKNKVVRRFEVVR